eukprot:161894-Amphidinium_carterae.1
MSHVRKQCPIRAGCAHVDSNSWSVCGSACPSPAPLFYALYEQVFERHLTQTTTHPSQWNGLPLACRSSIAVAACTHARHSAIAS